MTNTLIFDIIVDKATHTIYITREFSPDLDLVWDAFTNAEYQIKMADLAHLEKFVAMGFKEGISATFKNLENLLASSSKQS